VQGGREGDDRLTEGDVTLEPVGRLARVQRHDEVVKLVIAIAAFTSRLAKKRIQGK